MTSRYRIVLLNVDNNAISHGKHGRANRALKIHSMKRTLGAGLLKSPVNREATMRTVIILLLAKNT